MGGCYPSEAVQFRLVRQLSSGPDGVSYLGVDESDRGSITIDRLFLARRFPPRWSELKRRLQLVAHLSHEHVLPVRAWSEDGEDPYLVTIRLEKTLADAREAGEVDANVALAWVRSLACALAQGHRLGLVHGELCPSGVVVAEGGRPVADLCGVRTGSRRLTERDRAFYAADGRAPTTSSDVFALAALCVYLWNGQAPTIPDDPKEPLVLRFEGNKRLATLLAEMLDRDPDRRPSIHEVVERLRRVESLSAPDSTAVFEAQPKDPLSRREVGRFELGELIGEGAMGRVYRARDTAGGPDVALKLLRPHWAEQRDALRRFYREARVLSELDNPHIARFFEVNEDAGLHYLAMEFIEGQSLGAYIDQEKALDVDEALSILRDIAFALADVHDLGVVHRDIKPANVLLVAVAEGKFAAKLCDFGIARPVEGEDELTQVGIALGTPHYMAPEQGAGADIDARSDIYALGITFFKMVTGQVPFNATDPRTIVYKHMTEPVPDILTICPDLGAGGANILGRMLAKSPDERYANGRELLEAIEQLQRGAPARMVQHPRSPESVHKVLTYDFEWHLASSPEALWPHVSNTERLNRAIGLDAIEFRRSVRNGQVETYGRIRLSGLLLEWREHRYEWVAPQRMGVLREFSQGPFVWLKSSVELLAVGSGTLLRHQIQVEPRGVLGRAAASLEVGIKAKKNLERVYQRIDRFVSKSFAPDGTALLPNEGLDPFEEAPKLTESERERLRIGEERLLDLHLDDDAVTRLCDFLRWAPPQDVARIRPRAFARHFTLDHREVLRVCLHATRLGLLTMFWDVICPRCQIPSSIQESLRALRAHGRCEACDVDFELDFGNSVEIVFRAHPEVRASDLGTYCIGGPGHTPHVVAQVRLAAGERFAMDLKLEEGHYQVTGPDLKTAWGFSVRKGAQLAQWELNLTSGLPPAAPRAVSGGRQRLVLVNDFDREVVARVERGNAREDAVTAAEVACTALFRELFPGEALSPGQLVAVSKVTLVLVELAEAWSDGASEARAFARLMELSRRAADVAEQEGGAVVKLLGDGVLLSFNDAVAAVRTSLALIDSDLRVGGHTGTTMATCINDRLDYFGRLVRELDALTGAATPGQALLSERLCSDAGVAALLARREPSLVFAAGVVAQAFTAS